MMGQTGLAVHFPAFSMSVSHLREDNEVLSISIAPDVAENYTKTVKMHGKLPEICVSL